MNIVRHRFFLPRYVLLCMFATSGGFLVNGCVHSDVATKVPTSVAGDACLNAKAADNRCTVAQRICLLARDLPSAIGQPDFIPTASYTAHGQQRVAAWMQQLTAIENEPALVSYAQGARRKLEQVQNSEHDRRLIVENGDLIHALKVLAQKAQAAAPSITLDCPLPE